MKTYIEDAHRTVSDKFHTDRVHIEDFQNVLKNFVAAANDLDRAKKALFYGRGEVVAQPTMNRAMFDVVMGAIHPDKAAAINLVHGIIGKATETGESVEALLKCFGGKWLDLVNVIEEVGDGLWYDALILKACNVDFETAQTINIEKLRRRFPEKFTEHDANNRDLAAERATLEGSGQ